MIFSAFSTALEFFEKRGFLESEKSLVFGLNSTFTACVTCIFRPRITRTWSALPILKFSVLPGNLFFNPPSRLNTRFSYRSCGPSPLRHPAQPATGYQEGNFGKTKRAAPMGQLLASGIYKNELLTIKSSYSLVILEEYFSNTS